MKLFKWSFTCLAVLAASLLCVLVSCTVLQPAKHQSGSKEIILTIDDGPVLGVSDRMLEVLERQNVKAVFCYIGENMKKHPEIVTRALDDGHLLVNHSMHHNTRTLSDYDHLRAEVDEVEQLIDSLPTKASHDLKYFRPPFGFITPAVRKVVKEKDLKYAYVTSYIHEAPYEEKHKEKTLNYYKKELLKKGGGAIVFHEMRFRDGDPTITDKRWLPEAVEEFIIWAKQKGFKFTLYE